VNPLTITLITATSALLAGIAGPIVSVAIARQQIKASVISNNRERWVEALRDALAEYVAAVTSAALIEHHSSEDLDAIVRADQEFRQTAQRMLLLRSKILLMTNPTEVCADALYRSIETVHATIVSKQGLTLAEWHERLEAITAAGRAVLRAEWARVKRGD
jgi:hypothetical protein